MPSRSAARTILLRWVSLDQKSALSFESGALTHTFQNPSRLDGLMAIAFQRSHEYHILMPCRSYHSSTYYRSPFWIFRIFSTNLSTSHYLHIQASIILLLLSLIMASFSTCSFVSHWHYPLSLENKCHDSPYCYTQYDCLRQHGSFSSKLVCVVSAFME